MNAIGIDYQRSYTIVCLRVGEGDTAETRLVSDGLRVVIPNVIVPTADQRGRCLWGSMALRDGAAAPLDALGPEREAQFWMALHARLESYLGGTAPTVAEGYECIIAEPQPVERPSNHNSPNDGLLHSNRLTGGLLPPSYGGLEPRARITAPDALLCAWLSAERPPENRTVVTVALGDETTEVRGYRWEPRAPVRPRVRCGTQVAPIHAGYGHWMARLRQLLATHFPGSVMQVDELALRDALDQCAQEVTRTPDGGMVAWKGPQRDRMAMRFQLSRAACLRWEEAQPLLVDLPARIREAMQSLGGASTPDQILLGGRGALWPFAQAALNGASAFASIPRWQSEQPVSDIARGAAWWPACGAWLQTDAVVETYIRPTPPPASPISLPQDEANPEIERALEIARAIERVQAGFAVQPPTPRDEAPPNDR